MTLAVENYSVVSSQQTTCEQTAYTAYGIAYQSENGMCARIDDVSCEKPLVSKMVEMFNLCELHPDRLLEAVLALLP